MKKIKLLAPILAFLPLASISVICSCNKKVKIKVEVTGDDYTITEQSINLTYKLNVSQKIDKVSWSVNDETIAKIDSKGKLTGLKEGFVKVNVNLTINNETVTGTKEIVVIDKTRIEYIEFLEAYGYCLNNYLQSSKQYSVEPVGEYQDMEFKDQIVEKMILTEFPTYPNQHFLRIFTLKQRTFNFCAAGRSVYDMAQLVNDLYQDSKNELKNTEMYSPDYYLKETYSFTETSITYQIVAQSDSQEQKYYLIELRINSNGYIEKFDNTTNSEWVEHANDYGCFEVKYIEK